MFNPMRLAARRLESYRVPAGEVVVEELSALAAPLRGLRLLHLSFSPYGTAMAELVGSLAALLRDLGLEADWQVVGGGQGPEATAAHELYRGLSGRRVRWGRSVREAWQRYGATLADQVPRDYDFVLVHEPQPLAVAARAQERGGAGRTRWLWHTHLDLRRAQPEVWDDVRPLLGAYSAILLSSRVFAAPEIPAWQVVELPPGLDPLSARNLPLAANEVDDTLARFGLDPSQPLVVQVGPLDAAHDPMGAVKVYLEAKAIRPDSQLVLLEPLGSGGGDSWARFEQVLRRVAGEPDVHVLAGVAEAGHQVANAVQRAARVVIQRSVPAGYPMTVLEAQWKGLPVVVGPGSMRDLIAPGDSGVVAENDADFSAALVGLLGDETLAHQMGAVGHALVRERFLLTRLARDLLRTLDTLDDGR